MAAHIADCCFLPANAATAGAGTGGHHRLRRASYIVPPLSPLPPPSDEETTRPTTTTTAATTTSTSKPWVWRMAQAETRKYQLFPRSTTQATASPSGTMNKGLDSEQGFALCDTNKSSPLRLRISSSKDHSLPARRRKVSVPELGPMTTVHESSMDSPTLPGRVGFHERSVSVPDNGWRTPNYAGGSLKSSALGRPPPSPKDLPPLTIPTQMSALAPLKRQLSFSRLRSGSSSNNSTTTPTSAARPEESPKTITKGSSSLATYTPTLSSAKEITTPSSTTSSLASVSTLPTPLSITPDVKMSPKLSTTTNTTTTTTTTTPTTDHRRNVSETTSIMDRGRPKKKSDGGHHRRTESKRSKSAERRAFETLPKGWRVPDALQMLDPAEAMALKKQAMAQAERFEIMRKVDVDSLSRELRSLDERCEYLRRTYHSLRAGRRNLHARICQYLRSPRTVKFSQESLLKQEEALAELDASIDDWVSKLEQAENRRTRVRQKLLEHVAAAATINTTTATTTAVVAAPPSTPPRSPVTAPPLPPTTTTTTTTTTGLGITRGSTTNNRTDVESIRIYAGNEVAALLADVEQQITRMSKASEAHAAARLEKHQDASAGRDAALVASLSEEERKVLHRTRSQEALEGGGSGLPSTTWTPRSTPPADGGEGFLLTAAVFNPFTAVSH